MVSIVEARAAAVTALTTANVAASSTYTLQKTPCVVMTFQAGGAQAAPGGKMFVTFSFTCVAGRATADNAARLLDETALTVYSTLRSLAGWRLDAIGNDLLRAFPVDATPDKQVTYLTRDVAATVLVDIT